jgi:hypothetical protein
MVALHHTTVLDMGNNAALFLSDTFPISTYPRSCLAGHIVLRPLIVGRSRRTVVAVSLQCQIGEV